MGFMARGEASLPDTARGGRSRCRIQHKGEASLPDTTRGGRSRCRIQHEGEASLPDTAQGGDVVAGYSTRGGGLA